MLYAHLKKTHSPEHKGTRNKMYTSYRSEIHSYLAAAPTALLDVFTLLRFSLFGDVTQR